MGAPEKGKQSLINKETGRGGLGRRKQRKAGAIG